MADIGHEFLAGILKLLDAGLIMKNQDGTALFPGPVQDGGGIEFQHALLRTGENQVMAFHGPFLLQPVLGLIWGTALLDEVISPTQGAGVVLILSGITLVTWKGSVRQSAGSDDPG